ncbi:MAG: hypothetical protein ACM3S1_07505 [Hyphomicrobiales bacterium]
MQARQSRWTSQYATTSSAVPQLHDEVCFLSGKRLGAVVVTGGRAFKVRVGEVEVWLNSDAVFTREGGRVTLVCDADGLHRYARLPAGR